MSVLVGRDGELQVVERFMGSLTEGLSALVIEGEAGIGKTALWLEATRLAEAGSCRLLQARLAEAEARLSFVTLADLLVARRPPRSTRCAWSCMI